MINTNIRESRIAFVFVFLLKERDYKIDDEMKKVIKRIKVLIDNGEINQKIFNLYVKKYIKKL